MKKIKEYSIQLSIGCLLIIGLLLTSCDKNFLERKPLTEISELDVWQDPNLARAFVARMYQEMDHGYSEVMIASLTDESRFIHDYNTARVLEGNIGPDEHGALWDFANWGKFYSVIRNANMYLENFETIPFASDKEKDQLTGEVYFLRAYHYFALLRMYGGVPLILNTFGLDDKENIEDVERATFEETIQQIEEDIDQAIALTEESTPRGQINKSAARALKSRVLLYAASDLYNQNGNDNPLIGYINADRNELWKKAKDAAWDIIKTERFSLYSPTDSAAENYARIFLDHQTEETIFAKIFDKELLGTSHDLYNGPNGYNNWGGNVPIQNMVDVYQLANGDKFDWSNPVHKANPYANRDPRFYATILYNGAPWKKRGANGIGLDPVGVIQTAQFEYWNGSSVQKRWGLDSRNSPIENWNGTYSGYYLRKFMDISLDAQFIRGDQDFIYFRYAEILLNYAEACLNLQEESEARTYIAKVRERAGMPTDNLNSLSGKQLMDLYQYERQVELAYEGHRFFDARRWMTAEIDFAKPAYGIEIYGKLQSDRETLIYEYNVVKIQERAFPEKMYFSPVPNGEIRKNDKIKQNPHFQQ